MPFIPKSVVLQPDRGKLDCVKEFTRSRLYNTRPISKHFSMNFENPIAPVMIGLIGLVLVVIAFSYLSPEARRERIRRKNNARIVSKAGRPTVRFNVRTKKRKK